MSEHYISIIKLFMAKLITRYRHTKGVPATRQKTIQTVAIVNLGSVTLPHTSVTHSRMLYVGGTLSQRETRFLIKYLYIGKMSILLP
jgi:hypothetical protein